MIDNSMIASYVAVPIRDDSESALVPHQSPNSPSLNEFESKIVQIRDKLLPLCDAVIAQHDITHRRYEKNRNKCCLNVSIKLLALYTILLTPIIGLGCGHVISSDTALLIGLFAFLLSKGFFMCIMMSDIRKRNENAQTISQERDETCKQLLEDKKIYIPDFTKNVYQYKNQFSRLNDPHFLRHASAMFSSCIYGAKRKIAYDYQIDPENTPMVEENFYTTRMFKFLSHSSVDESYQVFKKFEQEFPKLLSEYRIPSVIVSIIQEYLHVEVDDWFDNRNIILTPYHVKVHGLNNIQFDARIAQYEETIANFDYIASRRPQAVTTINQLKTDYEIIEARFQELNKEPEHLRN